MTVRNVALEYNYICIKINDSCVIYMVHDPIRDSEGLVFDCT